MDVQRSLKRQSSFAHNQRRRKVMKKINILSCIAFLVIGWLFMPSLGWAQFASTATPPACRPCPKVRFIPRGNCCWEVQIFGSTNTPLQHNGLKMVFSGGNPYFPVQLPPQHPNLAGWAPFAFGPPQTLLVYDNTPLPPGIPWGWNRLCDICFNPNLTTSVTVTCSFSENLGAT